MLGNGGAVAVSTQGPRSWIIGVVIFATVAGLCDLVAPELRPVHKIHIFVLFILACALREAIG